MSKSFTYTMNSLAIGTVLLLSIGSLRAQVISRELSGPGRLNQYGAFGPLTSSTARQELAPLNTTRLQGQDAAAKTGQPLRVGVFQAASTDLRAVSTVNERDGYRVYQYEVNVPGALALSAVFDQLQLAEGARIFLYNAAQTTLVGPITSQHNLTDGNQFTSGHITGDRLLIEWQEPLAVAGQSRVRLAGVANFYQPRGPLGGLQPAQSCQNNMACFPAYQPEGDGVALILIFDGTNYYICSGAMVNDARQSFRSFFLTAFHCIDYNSNRSLTTTEQSSAANWTFYFKYQSATCTPNADDNVYVTFNGSTFRSANAGSDVTLLELNAQAPQSENLSFSGWDRSSALASSTFGIHHPSGSNKKISFGGATTLVGVNLAGGGYSVGSGTSYLQLRWTNGVTEGGSSGSPLFDGTSRRIVGQLLGGGSFCTSQNSPDQYGRFFTSWTGGGTDATRLSNWLDPTGISGNTTNLAVPTVSGPAAFTNTGTFALNTGVGSIVTWTVTDGAGAVTPTSGSGNTAVLTALSNASNTNVTVRFTVSAGQSYGIAFAKTGAATYSSAPTPVSLRYFNGRITEQGALLGWETAREENNAYFQIERSRDVQAFESIATIPSQSPDGNSITPITYSFTDDQALPGTNYYRLVQTDRDGTKTRHNIIALRWEGQSAVLFPNPVAATGDALVEPAITHQGYQVTDLLGRVVQQTTTPGVLHRVSLGNLPGGVYLLRIQTPTGVTVLRVIR